jgi:drug/metabolite transporter (DMT)-like permease
MRADGARVRADKSSAVPARSPFRSRSPLMSDHVPDGQDNPALGIGLMVLALFLLSSMDAIAKHLTETLAVPQILAIRFWIFITFASVLATRRGFGRTVRSARPKLQIIRGVVLVTEMSAFIYAFSIMPLADVHAIASVSPLIVMVLAALFLGERIGPRRWAAVAVGFIGVLIIIRPGGSVFDPFSLIPLGAAFGWAVYQVLLRAVAGQDSVETTTFYTAAVGVVCYTFAASFVWREPSSEAWLWLATIGVLGSIGHFLLPMAYRLAPASTLQPFGYTMPVWAAFLGWLVFSSIPDRWTLIGGGIVIGSGLYALWRERVSRE